MEKQDKIVTDEDIKRYDQLVEKFIRDSVVKNWNEASHYKGQGDHSLGNSGETIEDIRQYLRMQVCIAIQKYDPEYRNKDGVKASEFTFVFQHLWNRIGQKMKKLTGKTSGYGVWSSRIENVLRELDEDG